MPAATAPLGKPSAKPTSGFTKPAGLSRQTSSSTKENTEVEEEEETSGLQPVHLGVSIVALLLTALFLFTTYKADQTPNRVSDYLFGKPVAADDAGYAPSASDDDSDDEEEAASSSSSASDDEDEDDEDDDE